MRKKIVGIDLLAIVHKVTKLIKLRLTTEVAKEKATEKCNNLWFTYLITSVWKERHLLKPFSTNRYNNMNEDLKKIHLNVTVNKSTYVKDLKELP